MNSRWIIILAASITAIQLADAAATPEARTTPHENTGPVNVIFDTDIWSDSDDAFALAMLQALEDRGEANLLAVTISTNSHWSASYVDLMNTYYGRPQVPIGIIHKGMDLEAFRKLFPDMTWPVTRYTQIVSERKKKDGTWLYPRHLGEGTALPEAVTLLRRTLAAQPDRSVVMIQTGYSTNLARLLESPPDENSALGGRDLIAKKVQLLSIMAGDFGETTFDGKVLPTGSPEFNLIVDVPSAQVLFKAWPTPIVASGFEIAVGLPIPSRVIEHGYAYAPDHPLIETYRTRCKEIKPQQCDAHPYLLPDPTAVLYAVRPDENYFSLSAPGTITVQNDGSSVFKKSSGGRHRHLILTDAEKARAVDAMIMLITQPPAHHPKCP
jgi:purine nucleosidase